MPPRSAMFLVMYVVAWVALALPSDRRSHRGAVSGRNVSSVCPA